MHHASYALRCVSAHDTDELSDPPLVNRIQIMRFARSCLKQAKILHDS